MAPLHVIKTGVTKWFRDNTDISPFGSVIILDDSRHATRRDDPRVAPTPWIASKFYRHQSQKLGRGQISFSQPTQSAEEPNVRSARFSVPQPLKKTSSKIKQQASDSSSFEEARTEGDKTFVVHGFSCLVSDNQTTRFKEEPQRFHPGRDALFFCWCCSILCIFLFSG